MEPTQNSAPCDQRERNCIDHKDPAGTDPNRNNFEQHAYTDYRQNFTMVPDNHPAAGERLLHPDKGELNN